MEVSTDPPEGTYMTNTPFTLLNDGKTYSAFAVKQTQLFPILAVYTIIIQFVFVFAWRLITGAIVGLHPSLHDTRIRLVGLILLWNSADPLSAVFVLGTYVKKLLCIKRSGGQNGLVSYQDITWAVALLLSALLTAGFSLAMSLNYGAWLELSRAAPVRPSEVVLPMRNGIDKSLASVKWGTVHRPSYMRAFGSREATSHDAVPNSYRVSKLNDNWELEYDYEVDAEAFGLQSSRDLTQKVQGRCSLRYDWIHPSDASSELQVKDAAYTYEYHLWGDPATAPVVAGDRYPFVERLHLIAVQQARSEEEFANMNRSFAFIIGSACVGSTSISNDPWYETEPISNLPDDIRRQYEQNNASYRIKPSRPALDCTQQTQYCITKGCYSLAEIQEGGILPMGTAAILTWRFSVPKIFDLAVLGGAFALQSLVGAHGGIVIDAEHSTLDQDMERLVLSAYLASKEAFRDSALMQLLDSDWSNFILDDRGNVFEGGADFVLRTDRLVALRLDLLVLAPELLIIALFFLLLGKLFRKDRENRFKIRQGALSAVHLFRILDERHTDMDVWEGKGSSVPLPSVRLPDRPFVPTREEHQQRYGTGPGALTLEPTLWYTSDRHPSALSTTTSTTPLPAQTRLSSEQAVLLTPGSGSDVELGPLQGQHDAAAGGMTNLPTSHAFHGSRGSGGNLIPRRPVASMTLSPYPSP